MSERPYHCVFALKPGDTCHLNTGGTLELKDLSISHARLDANGETKVLMVADRPSVTPTPISEEHAITFLGKDNGLGLFNVQGATEFPSAHFPPKPETNYSPRRPR